MTDTIRLYWEDHTCKADHESAAWATTDRGWLFAYVEPVAEHMRGETNTACVGHYLDYGPLPSYADVKEAVHAFSCVSHEKKRFSNVGEARTWIVSQAAGKVAEHMANSARSFGAYEHVADEIRKLAVEPEIVERHPFTQMSLNVTRPDDAEVRS